MGYQTTQQVDNTSGAPVDQKSTSNAAHVLDVAIHPGEDSTLDRTFGGSKCSGSYISTATTTVVKTGAGMLHAITVTETAAGAITVYDNTAGSGTVKAVLKASIAEGTYLAGRDFYGSEFPATATMGAVGAAATARSTASRSAASRSAESRAARIRIGITG